MGVFVEKPSKTNMFNTNNRSAVVLLIYLPLHL